MQLFLPLIENEDITGSLRSEDENDPVSEFIGMIPLLFCDECICPGIQYPYRTWCKVIMDVMFLNNFKSLSFHPQNI